MALLASLGEPGSDVIGVSRSVVIRQMAAHAGRGGDFVVVVDVAIGAQPRRHRVQPSQGEAGDRVVKGSAQP